MQVTGDISKVRKVIAAAKARGKSIGFIPTMGALHQGHLSLVKQAKKDCDFVVVSIFVNPTQFGPKEDLSQYPRPFDKDQELLKKNKVDLLFHPQVFDMYPQDSSTFIEESALSLPLCGQSRQGHFRGVCTVVAKLFNIVSPDTAYFGAKDFQQAQVIKRMVRDLNFPVDIKVLPTVRESDGLAMSSRNVYLNKDFRKQALLISSALNEAKRMIEAGQRNPVNVVAGINKILTSGKDIKVDYVNIIKADNLSALTVLKGDVLIAVAIFLGNTRLIDNITVKILK